ncbi:MAG: hypothetical protein AB8G05_22375 [Oligoflexales bacterium]
MKDLFLVPFSKLVGYRTFWIFLIIILGVTFAIAGIASKFTELTVSGNELPIVGLFTFPQVWGNASWFMKFGNYFLGFLVILLATSDDENKLLKQHIIDGWDREQVLASYLLVCGSFAFISLSVSIFISLAFGLKGEGPYFTAEAMQGLLYFLIQCFIVFEFALVLSLLLRKAVPAILTFIGWQLILEPLLGWILDENVFDGISEYLPFRVVGKLLADPFIPSLSNVLGDAAVVPINIVLIAGSYMAIFAGIAWLKLRFTDY